MQKFPKLLLTLVIGLSLFGCSASENNDDNAQINVEDANNEDANKTDDETGSEFSFSSIKSCEQLEPFLAPWADGLTAYDWNTISTQEIHCGWDNSADNVTPEDARTVEVNLVRQPELPDYSLLEKMNGYEGIEDDWVSENGGKAFTITIDIGISAAIGTTIWVPGVEITVSGGRWANLPELDGPAGIGVAKNILTLN